MTENSGRFWRQFRLPGRTPARIARDVDDELQFHLEMRVAELIARGHEPQTARAEAMRRFGDLESAKEYCQSMDLRIDAEQVRRDRLSELAHDLRFATRQLRASAGFTLLAVVTLALGIGATTAIFSVVNRLLINPMPYPGGDRIVNLARTNREGTILVSPTPKLLEAWRAAVPSLEAITAYGEKEVTITGGDEPEPLNAGTFEPSLTRLLGIQPALGRAFLAEEARPGASNVAMISYGFWRRRYGGARDVVGRVIQLDGAPFTIVGVLPRNFTISFIGSERSDLWFPLMSDSSTLGSQAMAKLRVGATREQANREMTQAMAVLAKERTEYSDWQAKVTRPQDYLGSGTRDMVLILLAAVGMVLLIACANIANLLMARASTRQREFAIRAALGAGRGRIMRQLLTESMLLAMAGGALGVFVAARGLGLIVGLRPESLGKLDEVRLDPIVLLVALGLTVFTGILFGLAPALFATGTKLGDSLKSATRSASGHPGARRFRSLLVVGEVALSVVLLVGAGLLLRTITQMQRADVGFEATGLTSIGVTIPESRYKTREMRSAVYAELLDRVRGIRGVTEATWSLGVPPLTGMMFGELEVEGRILSKGEKVSILGAQSVASNYFRVMRLPLRAGRVFRTDGSSNEVMINEAMAARLWPGTSAVGRRIRFGGGKNPWSVIAGVARDVDIPRTGTQADARELQVYNPFDASFESATLVIRTDGSSSGLVGQLTRGATAIDPLIRIRDEGTVSAMLDKQLAGPRFNVALLTTFAAVAVLLAAVGLYGVIAYSVSQRTRELGIRLALGARAGGVLRLVLGQGARLTLAGVVVGLVASAAATRLLRGMLFGVSPLDPATFAAVGALLGGIALLASYLPARRATRVDPAVALRAE